MKNEPKPLSGKDYECIEPEMDSSQSYPSEKDEWESSIFSDVMREISGIMGGCDHDPRRDMHYIDPTTVESWITTSEIPGWWTTESVDSICPYCNMPAQISLHSKYVHTPSRTLCALGRCPSCRDGIIRVFFVGLKEKAASSTVCSSIWMDPAPNIRRLIVNDLPEMRIFYAYKDSIRAFNAGMWSLAISSCGRVVEGIGKTKFPNSQSVKQIGPLYQKLGKGLKSTPDYKEILQPFLDLGEALRIGRNPGSHFDFKAEPDRDLADKMLDLTEFLIRYVFLISDEVSKVNEQITKLGPREDEEEEDHLSDN